MAKFYGKLTNSWKKEKNVASQTINEKFKPLTISHWTIAINYFFNAAVILFCCYYPMKF